MVDDGDRPDDGADAADGVIPLQRVDVIINHRSGASKHDAVAEQVTAFLTSRGRRCRVRLVRTRGELEAAVAHAAAGNAELVVAGGGDGTVAMVATALLDTPKVLGVLPLGTFNYFARSINVPLDIDGALEVLVSGAICPASVGEVNGRVFVNNSSIGLYPAVLRQRESAYRQLGRSRVAAYLSAALVLIRRPAFLRLEIIADGVASIRRTPLLFVGVNIHQMASFAMTGGECLHSGRLAICIARASSVARLWGLALRAFVHGLDEADGLEIVCARELSVGLRRRRVPVAMDGEIATLQTPLRYRLRVDSLRVVSGPGPAGAAP